MLNIWSLFTRNISEAVDHKDQKTYMNPIKKFRDFEGFFLFLFFVFCLLLLLVIIVLKLEYYNYYDNIIKHFPLSMIYILYYLCEFIVN